MICSYPAIITKKLAKHGQISEDVLYLTNKIMLIYMKIVHEKN